MDAYRKRHLAIRKQLRRKGFTIPTYAASRNFKLTSVRRVVQYAAAGHEPTSAMFSIIYDDLDALIGLRPPEENADGDPYLMASGT